jgi:hypothetical protein
MKTKWKTALFILGTLAIHASQVHAATCSVPSPDYPTIQSAVDDTTCGTINVAPGVYTENVSIPRTLTLNGAQAGQPVAGRTSGGPAESTVNGANPAGAHPVFLVDALSVTIDGFTVKNAVATGAAIGIQIKANIRDVVILNNIIDGITTVDPTATGTAAVYLQNSFFGVNVGNNDIRNVSSNRSATAILAGDPSTPGAIDSMFIHDNNITGISSTSEGAHALLVTKFSLTSAGCYFRDNHVSNLTGGGWAQGIRIECPVLDAPLIENDFTALTSPTDVAAIWFANANGNSADCSGNTFNLPISAFGVKIVTFTNSVGPMNGGCSWWGSSDGPGPVGSGHGAQVSPNISYAPWRIAPDGDCIGNNTPLTTADCKKGGWITHVRADGTTFKSQGDCMQYVNTGK